MRSHGLYDSWVQYVLERQINYYYYEDYDLALSTQYQAHATSYRLYTNPACDHLILKGTVILSFSINDWQGACVMSAPYRSRQQIDIRSLPTGLYVVRTGSKSNTQSLRFLRN